MFLPRPELDDRRWDDLVESGRGLIPSTAPGWTDHNVSDPGITLIELLAAVAERDLFQLDQVPDRLRRAALRLVGIVPAGPRPARTVLAFAGGPGRVPAGTVCAGADGSGTPTAFRTLHPVDVPAARVRGGSVRDGRGRTVDVGARLAGTLPLAPFGADPVPGAALTLRIDAPLPAGSTVDLVVRGAGADGPDRHHSARVVWEVLTGPDRWRACTVSHDDTAALTRDGRVGLVVPAPMRRVATPDGPRTLLRCRLARGGLDAAPEVVLVVGAVVAEQSVATDPVVLAPGTGLPGQRRRLPGAPVSDVHLDPPGWELVADLAGSGRADRHAVLDPTRGELRFGDGEHGTVPAAGEPLRAWFRTTRAAAGNVPAGTVTAIRPGPGVRPPAGLTVIQPLPATGGADAESLGAAERRARTAAGGSGRAVTTADVEACAATTPGTRIARVHARPDRHPGLPGVLAAGVTAVVVVPYLPVARPVPSSGLLRAVARRLDRHRLLGTRFVVAGPRYTVVGVHAGIAAVPGTDRSALPGRVTAVLDTFLHPLTGGPDGTGWPFGRDVGRAELLDVLSGVDGVGHVTGLELHVDRVPTCDDVCVGELGLVLPGPHRVVVT